MTKITLQEVDMLASLLLRAGVNQFEVAWANGVLDKLRIIAAEASLPPPPEPEDES